MKLRKEENRVLLESAGEEAGDQGEARLSPGGSDRGNLRGSGAGVEEDGHRDRSHCPEILRMCADRRTGGGAGGVELCSNANSF